MYVNKTDQAIILVDDEMDTIHVLTNNGINVKIYAFSEQIIIERLDGPKTENILIR